MRRDADLLDLRVRDLLEELAAGHSPLPGAGAAAALAAASAAALVTMAARRSIGDWDEAAGAAAQSEALRIRAAGLAAQIESAYDRVLRLRAQTGEPDERRDEALRQALERAANAPLRLAEVACDVAELGLAVGERGDPALAPDVASAAVLAEGAARVAAHLVDVNLATPTADERVTRAVMLADAAGRAARRAVETSAEMS